MNITFDKVTGQFQLNNDRISYVMQVLNGGYLAHLYFGSKISRYRGSAALSYYDRGFSPQPYDFRHDRTFSLDTQPLEYSTYGIGDYRITPLHIQYKNGSTITDLRYKGHKIIAGKPELTGLPATYALSDEDAQTLEIELVDETEKVNVFLSYTIFHTLPVICRSSRILNNSDKAIRILKADSLSLDFRDHDFDMLTLYGAHANERNLCRQPLQHSIQTVASNRGASSHQQSPFIALAKPQTNEQQGEVYGFSLVYSGNFAIQTEVDQFGCTRLNIGLNPLDFSWQLTSGQSFQTPETVSVYSAEGLNDMSHTFHQLYRTRLIRGSYKEKLRPILVNNWEATYFDFNEAKIDQLASDAADLGIELLVLDDGWFGQRNDDNTSLGDWFVNTAKLPDGLKGLAEKVIARGLKFGLWVEPEMVSEASELYKAHADWCIQVAGHSFTEGRHQLILDLSRQDVCDYLVDTLSSVFSSAPISYVKWDMNRHMTEIGSAQLPPERQRETAHRYMLGLYQIMDKLTAKFPDILFESCSGGGGRFDAGILYYMPQTWTSDNTDAICRLKIQHGTSLVFPPISMGAHVSVIPNHQVGRSTPMQTRAFTAMAGTFGYELDLGKLSTADKAAVKEHVALYKKIRPTCQLGTYTRLLSPFESNESAWQAISTDGNQVVVTYCKILAEPASQIRILKLAGLDSNAEYKITDCYKPKRLSLVYADEPGSNLIGQSFGGDELMNAGITIDRIDADFISTMWILEKVK